jgi:multiple sugar transport system substrate-binding protein
MGHREVAVTILRWRSFGFAAAVAVGLVLGGPAFAQEKLTVWWAKGFYKSEDDALLQAVKKFEQKTGVTANGR